jgi:hypothetical protein
MGVLNFEIVVEEKGKSIPRGYDTFIKITISHGEETTVIRILARSNLGKPYLHEVNAYGHIKAINTHTITKIDAFKYIKNFYLKILGNQYT